MGLMKEIGYLASTGNRKAMSAAKRNEELLAERFPWAVPCSTELAEAGCPVSPEEYEQMELDLDPADEPWPPKDQEAFETWLEGQAKRDEAKLAALDEEVPF